MRIAAFWRTATGAAALAALTICLPFAVGADGQAPLGPKARIELSTNRILDIVRDPALRGPEKNKERRNKIMDAVDECFNWEEMAKGSLGAAWRDRTADEKKKYVALYRSLVRQAYMDRVDGYSGEQVLYGKEEIEKGYARVNVQVVTKKNTEIALVYIMKKYGDQWLVYDLSIEGVRLVGNYRTQFAGMLDRMSFKEFLDALEKKVADVMAESQ